MQLADPLDDTTYDNSNSIYHGKIMTKPSNQAYSKGWERIFGKKYTITVKWKKRIVLYV